MLIAMVVVVSNEVRAATKMSAAHASSGTPRLHCSAASPQHRAAAQPHARRPEISIVVECSNIGSVVVRMTFFSIFAKPRPIRSKPRMIHRDKSIDVPIVV